MPAGEGFGEDGGAGVSAILYKNWKRILATVVFRNYRQDISTSYLYDFSQFLFSFGSKKAITSILNRLTEISS